MESSQQSKGPRSYGAHLERTLELARGGRFQVSPNPMVGAVLVKDGFVVGEGYHRRVGGPHAEIEAMRDAGPAARGATLFVNLEPCSFEGRTPPCTDAVIKAGVARVVACLKDPHRKVAGEGFRRLRAAGIDVESGFLVPEAISLNLSYLAATVYERPSITLKWAMSLDGRIATTSGESQWISSPEGRHWALVEREAHDAILVGSGTVLADDPRLTRRLSLASSTITRVVLDRRLRTPAAARLFAEPGTVLIYTETAPGTVSAALEEKGATVVVLPRVAPQEVASDLWQRGIRSLLVEGGSTVLGAFVEARQFDRVAACCAGLLVGGEGAPGPVGGAGLSSLASAVRLEAMKAESCGPDFLLTGIRRQCLQDLLQSVAE